jgi:hypothetical protein
MHTGSVPRLHDPFHAATLSHVAVKWAPVALLEATSAHTADGVCGSAPERREPGMRSFVRVPVGPNGGRRLCGPGGQWLALYRPASSP